MPHIWIISPVDNGNFYGVLPPPDDDSLFVPELEEISGVVDHFFDTFNQTTPFFDHSAFMQLLHQWYSHPEKRDKATWAAIQIVLAIGYRTSDPSGRSVGTERAQKANEHLRNVQLVVPTLVTREEDLLGLQVLMGMVVMFLQSSDHKPAAVIIGNASRLAYRLNMHKMQSMMHCPTNEIVLRQRMFWLVYYLDRVRRLLPLTQTRC